MIGGTNTGSGIGGSKKEIYGISWTGASSTKCVRTDNAVDFPDPVPYYSGMSATPSSPFDNILPWAGMVITEDATLGTMVSIPKFYYKWTKSGNSMQLQIADWEFSGSKVSPAHMDRGDGYGERDVVYVGRYHCNSSFKSVTNQRPFTATNYWYDVIDGIQNLSPFADELDFHTWWTVNMLYLVEYADWNSQSKIGYGGGSSSGSWWTQHNTGSTDTMPYHTGTMQTSKTTYGIGVQYRYIEDWWSNYYDVISNLYVDYNSNNLTLYPRKDWDNGIVLGQRPTRYGYISSWTIPTASGGEFALYPNGVSGSGSTYISDIYGYDSSYNYFVVGGGWDQNSDSNYGSEAGAFAMYNMNAVSSGYYSSTYVSGRPIKLP